MMGESLKHQRLEEVRGSSQESSERKQALPTPWFLASSPQNYETKNICFCFCFFKYLIFIWLRQVSAAALRSSTFTADTAFSYSMQDLFAACQLSAVACGIEFHVCGCARPLQSCLTLCDPIHYSLPGPSVHEILQARILAWVAVSFFRGPSQPRNQTSISCVPCAGRRVLYP